MGPTANDATIGDEMTNDDSAAIAQLIDHTLLKPEATREQIDRLCHEALEYHFASVCVNPTHISRCAELLRESDVKVCTVVGFPLGATTTAVKAYETRQAIDDGATEIDMLSTSARLSRAILTLYRPTSPRLSTRPTPPGRWSRSSSRRHC